jgi:hypothetical protein
MKIDGLGFSDTTQAEQNSHHPAACDLPCHLQPVREALGFLVQTHSKISAIHQATCSIRNRETSATTRTTENDFAASLGLFLHSLLLRQRPFFSKQPSDKGG